MSRSFLAALALAPLLVLGGPVPGQESSSATGNQLSQTIPDIDFDHLDVRDAIRRLMKSNARLSYSISPEVQGIVSGHLSGVGLEQALQMILSQVEASYRVEAGVLVFDKQEIDYGAFGGFYAEQPISPSVTFADTHYLYVVRGKWISKVSRNDYSVLASTNLVDPRDEAQLPAPRGKAFDPLRVIPRVDFDKVEIRQALHVLFDLRTEATWFRLGARREIREKLFRWSSSAR